MTGVAGEHLSQLADRFGASAGLQQQLRQMQPQREIVRRRVDSSRQ